MAEHKTEDRRNGIGASLHLNAARIASTARVLPTTGKLFLTASAGMSFSVTLSGTPDEALEAVARMYDAIVDAIANRPVESEHPPTGEAS